MTERTLVLVQGLGGFIETEPTDHDVYCFDCKQLRLWLKREEPKACGSCGSANIKVGKVNDEELQRLRHG